MRATKWRITHLHDCWFIEQHFVIILLFSYTINQICYQLVLFVQYIIFIVKSTSLSKSYTLNLIPILKFIIPPLFQHQIFNYVLFSTFRTLNSTHFEIQAGSSMRSTLLIPKFIIPVPFLQI